MPKYMVTTEDNPYDYFTQFNDWYAFDTRQGYNTLHFLGRIVRTSDALSPADQEEAINDAVNEIVEYNVLGIYKRIESKDDSTESE